MKDISPESLAARDGNIKEGDVVLKVRILGLVQLVAEQNIRLSFLFLSFYINDIVLFCFELKSVICTAR